MRLSFTWLFILFIHLGAIAQRPARIDSILNSKQAYKDIVLSLRQSLTAEELERSFTEEGDEKMRLQLANALCWKYFVSDPQKALFYAQKQMELAQKLKIQDALETGFDNFGFLYKNLGEYEKSILNQLKSLVIKEQRKDTLGISVCMNGIGGLYFTMENHQKALDYFIKGAHFDSLLNNKENLIDAYGNIGACYEALGQYTKALTYYLQAEKLSKEIGRKVSGDLFQNMGTVYLKKGDLKKAEEYLLHAQEAAGHENDVRTIVVANIALGDLYTLRKDYDKAVKYQEQALGLSRQNKLIDFEIQTLRSISNTFARLGNYTKAFEYQKMFTELKDTLLKEQGARAITEMNTKYETDKKEKQIEIQNLTLSQKDLELNKRQIIIYATAGGIGLLILLSFFIFRGYRQKKQANIELTDKNKIIADKSKIVEEQHKDITDSIQYAQRIQRALLPPDQMWFELLPESFVLYKPKDILSGDFYWIERKNGCIYVAAADCTGHGVPGALMSIVNFNLLNKAVLELNIKQPSEILDTVNKWLTISLHQSFNESAVRDGMDVALCSINIKTKKLDFSGAFNGGYLFKKDGSFLELLGDKMPVGAFIEEKMQLFTDKNYQLESGDKVFIFSDGYADQFGGPKGKKLKYAKLKQYIGESLHLSMAQQKEYLEVKFNEWKGTYEQVDDVLIIGFSI